MILFAKGSNKSSEDRITSLLLQLAKKIQNVLNKDINSFKFPTVIKKKLKTLKALLNPFTMVKKINK